MPNIESGLATLDDNGLVPETRMADAMEVKSRIDLFILADNGQRAYKRGLVKGLVDGNAPYNQSDLIAAGRGDMCNINWRMAEAYLATANAAVYDVFSQSATYAVVETDYGTGMEQQDLSAAITEEFDLLLKTDQFLDYEVQNSQYDMVLYGCGPMIFRSHLDWRPRYLPCGMFLVPEFAKSKTEEWEECAYRIYYTPSDLYNSIRNPSAASRAGWNVEAVKEAIMAANPMTKQGGQYRTWEWHQQQLKNSSYFYSAQSKSIHVGHYFFREFATDNEEYGMISEVMVDMSGQGNGEALYRANKRFRTWEQIVHPLYYDHGGGGYHHSVTGMGVKMYGAMAYQNRLICNLADKCFAPKILLKPTSAQGSEQLQLARFGDYGKLPPGVDVVQTPLQSFLEEGLAFNGALSRIVSSNLSQYRSESQKTEGNPLTATQVDYMASQEATLSQSLLNHYYHQLDWLYLEMYQRATNFNIPTGSPGAAKAKEFQDRCAKRGIPKLALKNFGTVTASRILGQGSAFLRKQSLMRMLNILPRLPEEGQSKLIRDYVASETGYSLVNRYAPERDKGTLASEDQMLATLQISAARSGVAPVLTGSQNPVVFAQMFLHAAADVMASIQKAGPQAMPAALAFLETIGPAIGQHLARIENDPTRSAIYQALKTQFDKMGQLTDQLHQQMQKMAQKQAQQQQQAQQAQQRVQGIQNGQDPNVQVKMAATQADIAMKRAKVQNDIANKNAKSEQSLSLKAAQARQGLAIKDLGTAQDLSLNHQKAQADIKSKSE